ncbi:MAG: SufD family Fe-S cluster assembly protein [Nanoarchaeota archaeon]
MEITYNLLKEDPYITKSREDSLKLFNKTEFNKIHGLGISITKEFNFPKIKTNSKIEVSGNGFEVIEPNIEIIKSFYDEKDKLDLFHKANWNGIALIKLKNNSNVLIKPSEINYISIDAEGKSNIIFYSDKQSEYKSYIIKLNISNNSEVNFAYLNKNSNNSYTRIYSDVKGKLNLFFSDLDNGLSISKINSKLLDDGAELKQINILYGDKDNQIYNNSIVLHENKNTRSNLIVRGVITDESKAIIKGLVHIKKNAIKSKGFQKEDIILLGDKAEADPIPELHIDTNDVECKHGATVGRIDKKKLFYLTSRGISEKDAKKLIVSGFFDSLLNENSFVSNEIINNIRCKYEY